MQLAVRNLRRSVGDNLIHSNLSFSLRSGEILFVRGPSGVGKSVLLRCLACLDPIDSGSLSLSGQPPEKWGLPRWRSLVTYVHQARIAHPGTPSQYYFRLQQLAAQRSRERGDLPSIVSSLGLEPEVLNQAWQELSVSAEGRLCVVYLVIVAIPGAWGRHWWRTILLKWGLVIRTLGAVHGGAPGTLPPTPHSGSLLGPLDWMTHHACTNSSHNNREGRRSACP